MKVPPRFFPLATLTLLLAAGALWCARLATRYQSQLQAQPAAVARWEQHIQESRAQRDAVRRRLDAAWQQPAISPAPAEAVAAAPDLAQATEIDRWVRQVKQLKHAFADRPDQKIPELAVLVNLYWLDEARRAKLDTEDNLQRAFAIMRNHAKSILIGLMLNAMNRYVQENQGQLPTDPAELGRYFPAWVGRYFNPTLDTAIFAQYEMVRSGKLSDVPAGPVLKSKSVVNAQYDDRVSIVLKPDSSLTYSTEHILNPENPQPDSGDLRLAAENAVHAFIAANHGALPTNPAQLVPYFNPPLSPLLAGKMGDPMSAEDQKNFQNDMAEVNAGHHLPK